jgi:hypothetical protein
MRALRFPSDESLVAVLAARLVPDAIAGDAVRWGRDDDGIWLVPTARLDEATRDALADKGVSVREIATDDDGRVAATWAEVLAPERTAEPTEADPALFLAPTTELVELAGELLRLGCDRQRWATSADRALLLAQSPPWYTVLKALDPGSPLTVYVEAVPRVWVQAGWHHPLAAAVRPPENELVLVPAEGPWIRASDGPWTSLYDRLDLVLPETPVTLVPDAEPPRIPVPLRLVDSGRSEPPSLWVLRDDVERKMDALLSHLPDDVIDRLLFAATTDDPPTVVLRARPSPTGPPAIEVQGERYAPLLGLLNLFRPDDTTLEPPLRRDKVREVLATEPFETAWLARKQDGGFELQRIAEEAFRPLSSWVDYVADRAGSALSTWVESQTFAFDDWVDLGVEWAGASQKDRTDDRKRRSRKQKPAVAEDDAPYEVEAPVARPRKREAPAPRAVEVVAGSEENAVTAQLAELEQRFLALESPADAPERNPLWREMATLNRQLGRDREASLCWTHALWDADSDRRDELARAWASEALGAVGQTAEDVRDAVIRQPDSPLLYATTACLVAGALVPDAELAAVFEAHDSSLDVRGAWLARRALAGDDELAIARARDRTLQRIRIGLSLEHDTPVFLRMIDAAAIESISAHLDAQHQHFHRTRRNRNVIEADPSLTLAYVNLIFAWGFAALGNRARANALAKDIDALDRNDRIHDALVGAYLARIDQALEGAPREAPLPSEASKRFLGLEQLDRYKVDRLRQASGILESQEHLDPFTTFNKSYEDARGPEFVPLRDEDDPEVLRPALSSLLDALPDDPAEKVRLTDGVLDFLPMLPPADALPLLERAVAEFAGLDGPQRAQLLEDALLVAGLLGRADLVRTLVGQLQDALAELTTDHLARSGESLAKGLRSLRRVGLQEEAADLLQGVIEQASGRDIDSLIARVAVAGGLTGVGREEAAVELLDEGLAALDGDITRQVNRLKLTRAVALSLAASPRQVALERLPRLAAHLPQITDAYNTNSHFCLSVLSFAESIVLGYADSNLALGPTARRWLDDAEYLVRRRIHRES